MAAWLTASFMGFFIMIISFFSPRHNNNNNNSNDNNTKGGITYGRGYNVRGGRGDFLEMVWGRRPGTSELGWALASGLGPARSQLVAFGLPK